MFNGSQGSGCPTLKIGLHPYGPRPRPLVSSTWARVPLGRQSSIRFADRKLPPMTPLDALLAFGAAAFSSLALVPISARLSARLGATDGPDGRRKQQASAVPL